MKEKMRAALVKLQRTGDVAGSSSFTYSNTPNGRSVKAKVFYNSNAELDLKVLEVKGYNSRYVRSRMKHLLHELSIEVLSYPGSGDDVWTKEHLSGLTPDQVVTLDGSSYYYAVNSGIIDCGGRQLGQNYQAKFQRYQDAACSPGGAIMKFSIFKL